MPAAIAQSLAELLIALDGPRQLPATQPEHLPWLNSVHLQPVTRSLSGNNLTLVEDNFQGATSLRVL